MQSVTNQFGFSIFEALIYIALFTFVISGGIVSAYNIFEGTARIDAAAKRETELNFVMRKLDWALGGGSVIEPDPGDPPAGTLEVLKNGEVYRFTTDGTGAVIMEEGVLSADSYQLTDQLSISGLEFEHTPATGTNPAYVTYTFEVEGEVIGPFSRYVRTN